MSDAYQHLMFDLDMDISKFTTSVSQVETAIKNVAASRKLAVGDEFIRLSETLDKLKSSLSNLNQVGLAPKETLKKVGDAAKQSRIALTSLSQVAQDLPFGFIGIQNNLPILLQSFQQLRETSTSNASALKALGQSLIGPGGVFLAFSIVTAGITAAIQKYGSLTEAISALSGKIDFLKKEIREIGKSFDEYNKALKSSSLLTAEVAASQEGQIEKVRILSGVVLDLSKSEHDRKAALEELKKLDKDRFGNYDIESGKLKGLTDDVINYTKSLIANAQANAFKDELSKTSVEIEKQKILIKDLNKQKEKLTLESKPTGVVPAGVGGTVIVSGATEAAAKADVLAKSLNGLDNQIKEANKNIGDLSVTQNDWKESLTQSTLEVLKYATGTSTLTEEQKKQQSQAERDAKKREKQYDKDLKFIEAVIKYYERLGKFVPNVDISGIQKAFFEISNQIKGFNISNRVKLNVEVAKGEMDVALRNIQMKAEQGGFKPATFVQTNQPGVVSEGDIEAADKFSKSVKRYKEELGEFNKMAAQNHMTMGELAKSFEDTQKKLNSAFFVPLTNMFTEFLTTGKFTFKSVGDAIKRMIAEIAAKIIVTGILKSLSAIMNPEGAQANKLQNPNYNGNGGGGNWLANAAKILGGALGGQMNPNFSGVSGGSTQMSGQVNMVLRGTDLVGSINRTNAVINRIG